MNQDRTKTQYPHVIELQTNAFIALQTNALVN